MACLETLKSYLETNNVAFSVQQHAPTFTAREVAAAAHLPAVLTAKVVVVSADDELVMLVLPAAYRVDLSRIYTLLEARLVRLADERDLALAFPDCAIGAMPPFGNLYGVPVYVDVKLAAQAQLVFQPGSHSETMSVAYADFTRLVQPQVADFAGALRELASSVS
jgi:Ala-tRNA(Pro) deacylase